MSSFEEDQATIAEALRRPKSRGNPWKGEQAVVAAVRKAHPHDLTE